MSTPRAITPSSRPALRLVSTKGMNREQWLQVRKQGIGASDAAAAVGLNPYQSPLALWMVKTGRDGLLPAPDPDDIHTPLYWGNLLEQYPNLTSVLELSPPLHYRPGDCTVHHGYTVHGGPDNTTDKPRWSYLFSYSPEDTRYWNGSAGNWGSERKRLGDSDNPVVCPRELMED